MQRLLAFFLVLFLQGCALLSPSPYAPKTYEKALPALLKNAPALPSFSVAHTNAYQTRLFAPWQESTLGITPAQATWPWRVYLPENGYYSETKQQRPPQWFATLLDEANFEALGSLNHNAITLTDTHVRNFPTHLPLFHSFAKAGEGYPFDYNQNTRISLMQPLRLSHYSKDGGWAFVKSAYSFGWIPSSHITPIGQAIQQRIIDAPKGVITKDHTPLHTSDGFITYAKLGTLLPLGTNGQPFIVQQALHVTPLLAPKEALKPWPLPMGTKHISLALESLLGEPYGWGGMFDHRDCSAMTQDFFTLFGLFLPRNSAAQKEEGLYISLATLTHQEKEHMIRRYGKPFLTLLYLPGHIMLYAGTLEETPLAIHNVWGVKTSFLGYEGRGIVGKAVVSDLRMGEEHLFVSSQNLLLSRLEGMSILPTNTPQERLIAAYPEAIRSIEHNEVLFTNGLRLPFHDGIEKSEEALIEAPSIADQLRFPYPALAPLHTPLNDPGRARNDAFFKALYGQTKEAIEAQLVPVRWLPSHTNQILLFHQAHGAVKALEAVSQELDALPPSLLRFVDNPAGTYNYRKIAKTNRLSPHSYGIAIDINTNTGHYWQWSKTLEYRNQIPETIVHIFEKHGFVWGGRWKHFDTFHFEYRPELVKP